MSNRGPLGVALLCFAALALRVWGINGPTITHPEAYAPRIDFPSFAQNPPERHTVVDIVRGTLSSDNHPPGYYFLMLPWTTWFGTGITALRLPSAIIGTLTVPLLFGLARRTEGTWIAALAATWLAFHGHHIFWSAQARMWVWCTATVVLAVWSAMNLREHYRLSIALVYLSSVVTGLWIEYSFWPVFAAHVIWEASARRRAAHIPPTIALQCLALVLASPVLVFLFSRLDASDYLDSPVYQHLMYTAAFGQWFDSELMSQWHTLGRPLHLALAVCGSILVALGVRREPQREPQAIEDVQAPHHFQWALWLSVLPSVLIVWRWYDVFDGRRYMAIIVGPPLAIAFGYHIASRNWIRLRAVLTWASERRRMGAVVADAYVMHSLVPLLILVVVHLKLPCLAPRGLLALTPFLLVLAARGLGQLIRTPRANELAIFSVAILGLLSSVLYRIPERSRDYKGLAAAIDAARRPADVLVIENAWYAQPLHYYLRPDLMPSRDHATLADPNARARFVEQVERAWVVGFGAEPRARVNELSRLLAAYREVQYVSAFQAGAALLER